MYRTRFALIALLILLHQAALDAQTPPGVPAPSVTLAATVEQPVCPEGQPAVLALALHNGGAERLLIGGSAFEESAFQITVRDGVGRAAPRTAVGERVLTPPMSWSANSTVTISPGQTLRYRFNLARLFDLSRAETYTVSVSRRLRPRVLLPPVSLLPRGAGSTPPPAPPRPAIETPSQEFTLTAGPLEVRMVEDTASRSGPTAFAPQPSHQTFLYTVSQYGSGVGRYRVGDDESLSLAYDSSRPPAAQVGKFAISLVATPDGRFLYVCNGGDVTVSQFRTGADGEVTPLSPPTVTSGQNPSFLLMDPKGRFLYAMSSAGAMRYTLGPDGRLMAHPRPSGAWDPAHDLAAAYAGVIDPSGTFLYACNGLTYGYRLAPDGTLTALPTAAPIAGRPGVSHDNAIALAPSGRFIFLGVSTEGASGGFDLVVPMRIAQDGTFTPIPGGARTPQSPPLPWPGFQPFRCTALTVDPAGRFLIVVNPGYLDCYRIGEEGVLTPLGMTAVQGDLDSVFFVPGGHIVYALNRNPASLLAFRLDDRRGLIAADVEPPQDVPFAASVASGVAPTPLKWGAASGGLAVSARLAGDALPADAPAVLTVTLKNVTARPLRLGAAGGDMASFRLSLVGPTRRSPGSLSGPGEPAAAQVPLLAAGHDLLDAPGADGAALTLPPGGERQYRFVLSRLADLTVAGFYTIQVSRVLPRGAAASSPVLHVLLEGPSNGIRRTGNGSGLEVL